MRRIGEHKYKATPHISIALTQKQGTDDVSVPCFRLLMIALVDFESAACRNGFNLLRQSERQDAAVIFGFDIIGVDAGHIKAAAEGAVKTLALYKAGLLVFLIELTLGADCKAIVLDVDVNILFLKAGELGFKDIGIACIADIGAEGRENAAAVHETMLKRIEITERVKVGHVAKCTIKRNKFKHNIYLHNY